jgi:hypothetical protein
MGSEILRGAEKDENKSGEGTARAAPGRATGH